MELVVLITTNNSYSALKYIEAAIELQHKIAAIFFYQDAVNIANPAINVPVDEINMQTKWQQLAKKYQLPLLICSSSALRRGLDPENFANCFIISSLGQLVSSILTNTRLVTFK